MTEPGSGDATAPTTEPADTEAQKDHVVMEMGVPSMLELIGGAQSFSEYDDFKEGAEFERAVDDEMSTFDAIVMNIRADEDLTPTEMTEKIQQATSDLQARLGDVNVDDGFRTTGEKQETKRVDGQDLRRGDFADRGEADSPSTWKLPLTRTPGGVDEGRIRDAITALQPGGFRGQQVSLTDSRSTVTGRISSAIGRLDNDDAKERLRARLNNLRGARSDDPGMTAVFKDANDEWRWLAIHTNRYRDKDGEIFSEDSHQEYVDWAERTKALPSLRLWHVPVDLGYADFIDYSNGFVVSSGTFKSDMQDAAERLAEMKGLRCSHGYTYNHRDLRDGVYSRYRTFEVTVVPEGPEANTLTAFFADQEVPMVSTDIQRKFLVSVLGEARVTALEGDLKSLADKAEEEGIDYKTLVDMVIPESPKASDPVGEPATPEGDGEEAPAEAPATPTAPAEGDAPPAEAAPAEPAEGAPTEAAPEGDGEGDDDATEADPPPSQDAPASDGDPAAISTGAEKALADALGPVVAKHMEPLLTQIAALKTDVEAMQTTRDEDIADRIRPKVGPTSATPASEAEGNVIPQGLAQQIADAVDAGEDTPSSAAAKAADPYAKDVARLLGGSAPAAVAS